MKKIIAIVTLTAIASFACWHATAHKSGEYDDSRRGVKVCVYQYNGDNYTYAVGRYQTYPWSITICR